MNPMYLPIYNCLPFVDIPIPANNMYYNILDNVFFVLPQEKPLTISVFIAGLQCRQIYTNPGSLTFAYWAFIASSKNQGDPPYQIPAVPNEPNTFAITLSGSSSFGPKPIQLMSKVTENLPPGPAVIYMSLNLSIQNLDNSKITWKEIQVYIE